jgi:NAD(P)H dehydrogenase (quinone)
MGGPAAQFKAFADATGGRWFGGAWRDKIGGGFTVSSGPSGDKLSTLHYFFPLAMQHGMVWIGQAETPMNDRGVNRLSSYSGVMAQAGQEPVEVAPNEADKLTGELYGKRVAEFAKKIKG